MRICRLSRLEMYWTNQHRLEIFEAMPRIRFQQIFRFLHLTNSNDQITDVSDLRHDCLFKAKKLLDLLAPTFQSQYNTHDQLSVDGL